MFRTHFNTLSMLKRINISIIVVPLSVCNKFIDNITNKFPKFSILLKNCIAFRIKVAFVFDDFPRFAQLLTKF